MNRSAEADHRRLPARIYLSGLTLCRRCNNSCGRKLNQVQFWFVGASYVWTDNMHSEREGFFIFLMSCSLQTPTARSMQTPATLI